MAVHLKTFTGKPRAVGNRVLVSDMYFGEQKTAGGIIVNSDDGKVHGIYIILSSLACLSAQPPVK